MTWLQIAILNGTIAEIWGLKFWLLFFVDELLNFLSKHVTEFFLVMYNYYPIFYCYQNQFKFSYIWRLNIKGKTL